MGGTKKITISVPEDLYLKIRESNIDISEVAVSALLKKIRLSELSSELKNGYKEMAEINLELAEAGIKTENEALETTEYYLFNDLTESE